MKRRRWGLILSGAFVAVLVLGGGGVLLGTRLAGPGPSTTEPATVDVPTAAAESSPPAPAPEAPSPEPEQTDASTCSLPRPSGDNDWLVSVGETPEIDQWRYGGSAGVDGYPWSATYGPGVVSDAGVRSCFQQSAAGALFAASSYTVQALQLDATLKDWLTAVTAGPGRDEFVAQLDGVTDWGEAEGMDTRRLRIRGFRVLMYDLDSNLQARIEVVVSKTASGVETTYGALWELRWVDGDWRVWMETPDAAVGSYSEFSTTALPPGYTSWSEPRG